MNPTRYTIADLIEQNAATFGQRPAWYEVDDGRTVTFAGYRDQSERLAAGLQQLGIRRGDRIGVVGKNSYEYFLLYGAAARLGAIMLVVNWRLSAEEMIFNLNDCSPRVVFADREFQPALEAGRQRLESVERYFNLRALDGGFEPFETLAAETAELVPEAVTGDDGFAIIHTAAVAGRPRGALVSHANVLHANLQFGAHLQMTPDDAHLNLLPLFHVGGLFMATMSFQAGALNVNMSGFDADRAAALIAEKRISVMFDFSPILRSLLEACEKAGTIPASLRAVVGLEAPETIEAYQKASGGTFHVMYGQTETSCLATLGRYDDRPGSAGRVIPFTRLRLVDDLDRPVAAGEVGEITVRGPMVFKGYWDLPEDTAYAFREGWHHTGDLGRLDADGFLWYAGRKAEKELIKPGGENVYPAEVEKAILQHPAVAQTVVFGVPDPKWKEGIKAVCVLAAGRSLTAGDLIAFVGERIARYKKPQYVAFVAELPVDKDGAVDREAVKKRHGGPQG